MLCTTSRRGAQRLTGHLLERQQVEIRALELDKRHMDNELRARRLRWFRHVMRIDHSKHCTGRIQERTGSTKSELEDHSKQRPTKDLVHLGGSRGGS